MNPDHLFLGTNQENQDDCKRKGRHVWLRGEALSTTKLKEFEVIEIRKRIANGEMGKDIRKDYPHISIRSIHSCASGATWKWL